MSNFDKILNGLAKDLGKGVHEAFLTTDNMLAKSGYKWLTLDDLAYLIADHGPDATLGALLAHVYTHVKAREALNMSEEEIDAAIRARGADPEEVAKRAKARAMFLLGIKKGIEVIKNE